MDGGSQGFDLTALAERARAASASLARTSGAQRADGLRAAAAAIRAAESDILAANRRDLDDAPDLAPAMRDRSLLDPGRIEAIARAVEDVADLPDPLGEVTERWTRPNGLEISKVRVPLGVIGIIYEARPNVTADAGALCVKSGNAVILRGGRESFHSSAAIVAAMRAGLAQAGLPDDAVQRIPVQDREAVGQMLKAAGLIDVIIPRGGKSLIARVQAESRVPVLAHLDGNCHLYLHAGADPAKARDITLNAKMRRVSVCGAAESLVIDRAVLASVGLPAIRALLDAGCRVLGEPELVVAEPRVEPATEADWGTEYLDATISAKLVDGIDQAIAHVERYGSHHTDAIVTEDPAAAERFLAEIDSAIVLVNASTQYADGGEFGFGAEIGISTGKLHVRGPVGAQHLTSHKYQIRGSGQVRP